MLLCFIFYKVIQWRSYIYVSKYLKGATVFNCLLNVVRSGHNTYYHLINVIWQLYLFTTVLFVIQSKALIPLQTEAHPETKQRVLTNYMFPQQPRHDEGKNIVNQPFLFSSIHFTGLKFLDGCVFSMLQITSLTVTALIPLSGRSRDSRGWLWHLSLRTRRKKRTTQEKWRSP